jgi:anti-anti-sigma factor
VVLSSPTPERRSNRCPVCGAPTEPSVPAGDAPCSQCGYLVWFTWEEAGDTVTIKPTRSTVRPEDLDPVFNSALNRQSGHIVMDMSDVRYLSSAALGKLINFKKKLGYTQRKLELRNLQPDLLEVLRITRLDRLLDLGR